MTHATSRTSSAGTDGGSPLVRITRAEARILDELLRDGAENRVIAKRLHLNENTVKAHMKGLMAATETGTRTALVVAVVRRTVRIQVVAMRAPRQRKPIDHGTWGGFLTHHRRDEELCEPCRVVGHEHLAEIRPHRKTPDTRSAA